MPGREQLGRLDLQNVLKFVYLFAILALVIYVIQYYVKPGMDIEEQARIAHAKRLFGDAWKESMKYD